MNQLRLEESVRHVLAKCQEQGDPGITRELMTSLLNKNAQETTDLLSILVRELWVFLLHNEVDNSDSMHSVPLGESPQSETQAVSPEISANSVGAKPSLVGKIALPSAAEEDARDSEGDASASDVPSSSEEEEEEETDGHLAAEMWKKTLSAQTDTQDQTHKDFFENLVKDVEGDLPAASIDENQHSLPDYELALDERVALAITSALSLAEQAQRERDAEDGDEDAGVIFTSNMLSDIGVNIAKQVGLEGAHAVRCAEDVDDCLCFLYGQSLDAHTKQYLVQTLQKLMLDRAEFLEAGMWFDPEEENDDEDAQTLDDTDAPLLSPTRNSQSPPEPPVPAVPAEEVLAPKSVSKAPLLVHQTPARTPYHLVTPGKSTASKRNRINYDEIAPDTPAWMIPKSPLDSIFRTGYGGIGQSRMKEVMALVEDDSDEDAEDESEDDEHHQRLAGAMGGEHSDEEDEKAEKGGHDSDHDAVRIDDIPHDFGRELLKRVPSTDVETYGSAQVQRGVENLSLSRSQHMSRARDDELLGDFDAAPRPEDHPSTSLRYENNEVQLTKNSSLNAMIFDSYKGFLGQYAAQHRARATPSDSHSQSMSRSLPHSPYDYDEATVGTSMDSEGYIRLLQAAKKMSSSPAQSPQKKTASPVPSPSKAKKPVVAAVVRTSKHSHTETSKHSHEERNESERGLMLESPTSSVAVPKKAQKDVKVTKKKRASTAGPQVTASMSKSYSLTDHHNKSVSNESSEAKKKRPSSAKKLSRTPSGKIESTEGLKKKTVEKAQTGARWKS